MSALLLVPALKTEGRVEKRLLEVVRILSERLAADSPESFKISQEHDFRG